MTAIARNSSLNPLATCFVPSSLKTFCGNETALTIVNEKKVKAVPKKQNTDENSSDVGTMKTLVRTLNGIDLARLKKKFVVDETNENPKAVALFNVPPILPRPLIKYTVKPYLYGMEAFGISSVISLTILSFLNKQTYDSNKSCAEITEIEEDQEDEVCRCPPMFGWVMPPTFLGNPFNLKYDCSKNHVHAARYTDELKNIVCQPVKRSNGDKWGSFNYSTRNEILEQCSLEFEMIIKDVCDSLRDEPLECEENLAIKDFLEVPDEPDAALNDPGSSIWNNVQKDETSNEAEIVDDGSHPLLQSLPSGDAIDEDEKIRESIETVEKILEICLTPGLESQPFDFEVQTAKKVCNPPCSVWCEYLPSAAKETFMKFKKSERDACRNTVIDVERISVIERPTYKRSFSANDTPMYANISPGFNSLTSVAESRERLLLLRKDPVAYFKHQNNTLNDNNQQYRSSYPDLSQSSSTEGDRSKMWGPFDGADSLWRPLPDCVPSSEQKLSSHKKIREINRQRSIN